VETFKLLKSEQKTLAATVFLGKSTIFTAAVGITDQSTRYVILKLRILNC
jgi:hypothetical protein